MIEALTFAFRYFWLFASITLILIGDTLFIMRCIQDLNETISIFRKENKSKSYLKGKFTPSIICFICNIILVIIVASLLFYCSEVIELRKII